MSTDAPAATDATDAPGPEFERGWVGLMCCGHLRQTRRTHCECCLRSVVCVICKICHACRYLVYTYPPFQQWLNDTLKTTKKKTDQ